MNCFHWILITILVLVPEISFAQESEPNCRFPGRVFTNGGFGFFMLAGDLDGDSDDDVIIIEADVGFRVTFNDGHGIFSPSTSYTLAVSISEAELADIDGDRDLDLLISSYNCDQIGLIFNNGDGTFDQPVGIAAENPRPFTIGDLDGDQDLDLAVSDVDSKTVVIMLNNGDTTFTAGETYKVLGEPINLTAVDLDNDQDLDLAVATDRIDDTDEVTTIMNNGDGTFDNMSSCDSGFNISLTTGDVNNDDFCDLIVGRLAPQVVEVFINTGDGTMANPIAYNSIEILYSVHLFDLDDDSDKDLIATCESSVSVFMNDGSGTFSSADNFGTGITSESGVVRDFDNDQQLDVAVSVMGGLGQFIVFFGNGDGSFNSVETIDVDENPTAVLLEDLDGDNDCDMAVASAANGNVSVLLNDGDGVFSLDGTYSVEGFPKTASADNLNGDSFPDLVAVHFVDGFSVLLNNGDGTFTNETTYGQSSDFDSVAIGDLDGDLDLDLALTDNANDSVHFYRNLGAGTFDGAGIHLVGNSPRGIALGDLDGDGDLDMAVCNNSDSEVSIELNPGNFAFDTHSLIGDATFPSDIAIQDVDGDQDLDIFVTGLSTVHLFSNNGDATFLSEIIHSSPGDQPISIVAADLDNDSDPDLAIGTFGPFVFVVTNNGDGNFAESTMHAKPGIISESIAAADLNGDLAADLAVANNEAHNVVTFFNECPNSFIPPSNMTVFRGVQIGGSFSDILESDDERAVFNPGIVINSTEAPVWLVFDAIAPDATSFLVESNAGTPNLSFTVDAF